MKPDLKIIEEFVSEADLLFREILSTTIWDERMKSRKTASYGVSYDYSGISYPETRMPENLEKICFKIEKIIGFFPNNCLMNYYLDGNSKMGFHSDSSEELLPNSGVAIISLGSERDIAYRKIENKDVKVRYSLKPGSLLYMTDELQQEWQHAIPAHKGVGERISLTFRHILK